MVLNGQRTTLIALGAVFYILFFAVSARSDDVSGVISGFIVDERSMPVAHALVSISAVDAAHAVRVTNDKGFFTFLGLLPGRYYVVASKGNRALCSGSLSVLVGVTTNIKVTLRQHHRSGPCSFTQPEYGTTY